MVSDENGHKFLEVVYVGDHLITEQIGLIELPDMLLIIGNIVSNMSRTIFRTRITIASEVLPYSI